MRYPTRVRYGLRFLIRLARQGGDRHLSMAEIAQEEGISVKYLEQIVSLLKPMGILQSVRGAHGGYALAHGAGDVTLERVFLSLGALTAPVPCLDDVSGCTRARMCATRPFWTMLDMHLRSYLSGVTLADIAADATTDGWDFAGSAALQELSPPMRERALDPEMHSP